MLTLVKQFFINILVFVLPIVNIIAQNIDYESIVKHANQTPNPVTNSTLALSNYLTASYDTEIEKAASIYFWIAKNIRYDDELAKNPRLYNETKEVVDEVMKSKSGVCQHYAELFAELARLAGLKAYVVDGYTLENGKVAPLSHAWNLINISGNWFIIDATWANAVIKGVSKRDFPREYFMIKPEESIKTHMPFDPIWQILTSPLKYDDFDAGEFHLLKGNFNYRDSINAYLVQNSIDQQKGTIRRMQNNGTFNKVIKKESLIKEKNLKTSIANQQILKYNEGIKYYNQGMGYLNQYIKLRNNRFRDKKYGKDALLNLIDSASANLKKAENNFEPIQIQDPEIKIQLKTNAANITKSKAMIVKEQEFVKQFFK
jgi:hypothetical protein